MSILLKRSLRAFSVVYRCSLSFPTRTFVSVYQPFTKSLTFDVTTLRRYMSSMNEETVIINLSIREVLDKGKNGVPIIDVREQIEIHNTGLIPGSVNIPLGHLEEAIRMSPEEFKERYSINKPAKEDEIIMSCQSGNRSRKATLALHKLGYTNVVNNSVGWKGYEEFSKSN